MIIVLIGKSAVGKDTTLKELCKSDFSPIVSTTTRQPRSGEQEGVQYHFVDKSTFEQMISDNKFIEYVMFNGNYYGSCISDFDVSKNQVIVLDPDGALALVKKYGRNNVFVVYMTAPDAVRKGFAKKRGSFDEDAWESRLQEDTAKFTDDATEDIVNYTAYVETLTPAEVADDILGAFWEYISVEKDPNELHIVRVEDTTVNHWEEPPCFEYFVRTATYIREEGTYFDMLSNMEDDVPF